MATRNNEKTESTKKNLSPRPKDKPDKRLTTKNRSKARIDPLIIPLYLTGSREEMNKRIPTQMTNTPNSL
jgi:hypothetical protein